MPTSPGRRNPSPAFIPELHPSAFPAAVSGGITMEQLLNQLGQPKGHPTNGQGLPGPRDPSWSRIRSNPSLAAISSSQLGFGMLPSLLEGPNPLGKAI